MVYDVIIVGSGPAGMCAAIYAKRAELDMLVIEKSPMSGGQIINTYEVENYLGFTKTSGLELSKSFRSHCDALGASFMTGDVVSVQVDGNVKRLKLANGDTLECRALIVATGAHSRKLGVPGETELAGMGVSYCATCDGAFFRGRTTAVAGGGDVAVEDAIFLSRLCKKVYVIHRRDEFRASKSLVTKMKSIENIELVLDSTIDEILGDEMVEGIRVTDRRSGEKRTLELQGVFIAVGNQPYSAPFMDIVDTDQNGYIIADETCATSTPGIFAAGDVRDKQLRQIITAAADGANAVAAVERYLIDIA